MLAYITNINRLMSFTEVTGVYFLTNMKQLKVLWEKKPEFCNFKAGGTYSSHPVLKGHSIRDFTSYFIVGCSYHHTMLHLHTADARKRQERRKKDNKDGKKDRRK
jgi:hypothetical protein